MNRGTIILGLTLASWFTVIGIIGLIAIAVPDLIAWWQP